MKTKNIKPSGSGKFKCPDCGKEMSTRKGLSGHLIWVHQGKHPAGGRAILEAGTKPKALIMDMHNEAHLRAKAEPKIQVETHISFDPMLALKPWAQDLIKAKAKPGREKDLAWALLQHCLDDTSCPDANVHNEALDCEYFSRLTASEAVEVEEAVEAPVEELSEAAETESKPEAAVSAAASDGKAQNLAAGVALFRVTHKPFITAFMSKGFKSLSADVLEPKVGSETEDTDLAEIWRRAGWEVEEISAAPPPAPAEETKGETRSKYLTPDREKK